MARLARDVMTPDPACCTRSTSVDEIARLMVQNDCGEIPILDTADHVIGVVTDRDIVCRVVAEGKNPMGHSAEECMTQHVVTVREEATLEEVVRTLEDHQIRRVPVVANGGCCTGIIAQADVAREAPMVEVAELVREVSKETGRASR